MTKYVWQHGLKGESDRLRLMSDLLDPSSAFHILRTGITTGWRCLEIGAGNGSLSQWLAQRVGPAGHVTASDIDTDLMKGIAGGNLEVRNLTSCTTSHLMRRTTLLRFERFCTIFPNVARL